MTMWEHLTQPCQKDPALTSVQPMIRKAQHLHLAMWGTNPPCQKALHLHLTTNVRKDQHLYLTMQGTNPSCRKGSALTSVQPMIEKACTHIWSCRNQSYNHIRKAHQHSNLTMWEHLPQPCQEVPTLASINQWSKRPSTYTWPCKEPILHAKRICTYIWKLMS